MKTLSIITRSFKNVRNQLLLSHNLTVLGITSLKSALCHRRTRGKLTSYGKIRTLDLPSQQKAITPWMGMRVMDTDRFDLSGLETPQLSGIH